MLYKMNKFINLAEETLKKSPGPTKHSCVIVSGGKIISRGFNYHADEYCVKHKRYKSNIS